MLKKKKKPQLLIVSSTFPSVPYLLKENNIEKYLDLK